MATATPTSTATATPTATTTPTSTSTATATPVASSDDPTSGHATCLTARPIALGSSATGYLRQPGEKDWFAVQVTDVLWAMTIRLSGAGPAAQALLTVNCGQGLGAQAAGTPVPIVPLGQAERDAQGWSVTAVLTEPGTYQIVVRDEKRGLSAQPYELLVSGTPGPSPSATATPRIYQVFVPVLRRAAHGW